MNSWPPMSLYNLIEPSQGREEHYLPHELHVSFSSVCNKKISVEPRERNAHT